MPAARGAHPSAVRAHTCARGPPGLGRAPFLHRPGTSLALTSVGSNLAASFGHRLLALAAVWTLAPSPGHGGGYLCFSAQPPAALRPEEPPGRHRLCIFVSTSCCARVLGNFHLVSTFEDKDRARGGDPVFCERPAGKQSTIGSSRAGVRAHASLRRPVSVAEGRKVTAKRPREISPPHQGAPPGQCTPLAGMSVQSFIYFPIHSFDKPLPSLTVTQRTALCVGYLWSGLGLQAQPGHFI